MSGEKSVKLLLVTDMSHHYKWGLRLRGEERPIENIAPIRTYRSLSVMHPLRRIVCHVVPSIMVKPLVTNAALSADIFYMNTQCGRTFRDDNMLTKVFLIVSYNQV